MVYGKMEQWYNWKWYKIGSGTIGSADGGGPKHDSEKVYKAQKTHMIVIFVVNLGSAFDSFNKVVSSRKIVQSVRPCSTNLYRIGILFTGLYGTVVIDGEDTMVNRILLPTRILLPNNHRFAAEAHCIR